MLLIGDIMAIQNRQSNLFAAEDWTVVYQAFRRINLTSYDYDTIRTSMIDHLRTTYPESFNDWIENDEFIFILDTISYLGQNLAFRMDLNTRENFIDTASRRESVLRLATMLSYNPSRNYPSRGLVKLNQITTSFDIRDSNGRSLAGVPIRWNDPLNPDWYEQFILVLNSSLIETNLYGNPVKQVAANGIQTHLYQTNTIPFSAVADKFTTSVGGNSLPFEIVNPDVDNSGIFSERHPDPQTGKFLIYRNDGNGFASPDTGFFLYFKQGTLKFEDYRFDIELENRTVAINTNNINELDVWVQEIADDGVVVNEWTKVPSTQNVVYNSVDQQITDIFSVITRDNDQISVRFPDSLSGSVPRGDYRVWFRTSSGTSYTIKISDMQNLQISYDYTVKSEPNVTKTLDMQFSLQYQVQNAQAHETIEQIRVRAPQNYYTSNRLITGEDYNVGPLSLGNLILKNKAINRTYSGHSRFIDINDPTGLYQNVDVFSDHGIVYPDTSSAQTSEQLPTEKTWETVAIEHIQPLLSTVPIKTLYQQIGEDGVFWNSKNLEQNKQYRVSLALTEPLTSPIWFPTAGRTPYGVYGSWDPAILHSIPDMFAGSVFLTTKLNGEKLWNSVASYNADVGLTGEWQLSSPIVENASLSEYYPDLRSIFTQQELTNVANQLSLSENFGLTYDINKLGWTSTSISDSAINKYINSEWEDLPREEVWYPNNPYKSGDVILYSKDSGLYKALTDINASTTFDVTMWEYLGSSIYKAYKLDASYISGTFVVVDHLYSISGQTELYECLSNTTDRPAGSSNWRLIERTLTPSAFLWGSADYETGFTTFIGANLVRNGTTVFQARTSVLLQPEFDLSQWIKVGGKERSIFDPFVLCRYRSSAWDFITVGSDYVFYGENLGFYFTEVDEVNDINSGLAQNDLIKFLRSNYDPDKGNLGYSHDILLDIVERTYQVDGFTDYTRVKIAPSVDAFNNPLNPGLIDDIVGNKATSAEDLFWRLKNNNTESYMDLTKVHRDPVKKLILDPDVEFFILSDGVGLNPDYGWRDTIYGATGVIYAFKGTVTNNIYEYFKITETIDELDGFSILDFTNAYITGDFDKVNSVKTTNIYHYVGRRAINFLWKHFAPSNHRIDPAITNINDIYVLTNNYYDQVVEWAAGNTQLSIPKPPTSTELRTDFIAIEEIKAISDTVIWHSARFLPLFGATADQEYQAAFRVVRSPGSTVSDDEIKQQIISLINKFFEIDNWDFGENFFFTELSTYIHQNMITDIASVVIVPRSADSRFGTLFEIPSEPDQVFISTASVNDVEIVESLTVNNIRIGS